MVEDKYRIWNVEDGIWKIEGGIWKVGYGEYN